MNKNLKILLAVLAALIIFFVIWVLLKGSSNLPPPLNGWGDIINW